MIHLLLMALLALACLVFYLAVAIPLAFAFGRRMRRNQPTNHTPRGDRNA